MRKLKEVFLENKDLFPTKWSLFVFIAYMSLFISQGLLVTASRLGDVSYPYNTTTVVLLTEVVKLILSSSIYISRSSMRSLLSESWKNRTVLLYYLVPALLYCLYNNLAFTNLAIFDPTTYFMFMQTRLLMTGVIYQFLFRQKLSGKQWVSLIVLTLGCMVQKLDPNMLGSSSLQSSPLDLFSFGNGAFLIMVQVCCSVVAGVYNEYIIKNIAGHDVDIMIQNVFMYLDSIVCNLFFMLFKGELVSSFTQASLADMLQFFVVAIVINNCLVGIVTSLFLKSLNSILKAFASALELIFTAILSFLLLGIPLHWNTMLAVAIVSYAVVMYAQNPVKPNNPQESLPVTTGNHKIVITPKK